MSLELGIHQLKAVEEIHNGSVLRGGVGTGKSRTAIAYFYTKECGGAFNYNRRQDFRPMVTPKDLFVITTAKKRDNGDWLDEAARFGLGRDRDVSAGHVQVTIDSWNNIENYKDVKDAFFIFDEQRLVGAGAWVKAFIHIAKHNRWIVLSATPGDTWMDYVPIFIANGWYKNRREFYNKHVIMRPYVKFPQIERYVGVNELVRHRNAVLVEMPYDRTTVRHTENFIVDYNKKLWDRVAKDRWHIYEDRPIKTASELLQVMRRLVNSDVSRIGALMALMEKHPKLIVFYNFNYELDILRTLANTTGVAHAEWNGHKHQEIPESEPKWLYFVQYTAGAEGWNCISTDTIAFWSANYSYKVMEQSKGRIDRLNTPYRDLWYYLLRSNSPIDVAIARALVLKKNFNEKEIVIQWHLDDLPMAA